MATDRIKIEVNTEEVDKWLRSALWHKSADGLPTPFVSVLAYVPDEAPLPTVHEGYVDDDGGWHLVYLGYQTSVKATYWMEMPKPPENFGN